MSFKIISDSSSDLLTVENANYDTVPLKISTSARVFTDTKELDTGEMLEYLSKYNGRSSSSCPNVSEWLAAFGEAKNVFCVTITSGLSGSYNSACAALQEYTEADPSRKGYVIDTLSVGPESALIIEKLSELIAEGNTFEKIVEKIDEYKKSTHLIFGLRSLHNLAVNGRVSPVVAKVAGILGIRIIGKASAKGTLDITNKSRGAEKAISDIIKNMSLCGYSGGRVRLHHCENPEAAEKIRTRILEVYPNADITVQETRGLCCFYAERGGVLVGYEGGVKEDK